MTSTENTPASPNWEQPEQFQLTEEWQRVAPRLWLMIEEDGDISGRFELDVDLNPGYPSSPGVSFILQMMPGWHDLVPGQLQVQCVKPEGGIEVRSALPPGRADWLDQLGAGDRASFLAELRQAAATATPEDLRSLKQLLHEWQVTAGQLADPEARAVLLAERP